MQSRGQSIVAWEEEESVNSTGFRSLNCSLTFPFFPFLLLALFFLFQMKMNALHPMLVVTKLNVTIQLAHTNVYVHLDIPEILTVVVLVCKLRHVCVCVCVCQPVCCA